MSKLNTLRIDEVSKHYFTASQISFLILLLFWITVLISFFIPFIKKYNFGVQNSILAFYILIVIAHYTLTLINKFYMIPNAEALRRKQFLSDVYGTKLCHEKTKLYYNNSFPPSDNRLAANTMENALFSKEITAKMLVKVRFITVSYLIIWILIFTLRHNNLEILMWITQVIFSAAIITQWFNLEFLRNKAEHVFESLNIYFLLKTDENTPEAKATIFNAFTEYESGKATCGIILSTKVFNKLNPEITKKWDEIKKDLRIC